MTALATHSAKSKRVRQSAVDDTSLWDAAMILERVVGEGFELIHTHRLGWLLRRYEPNRERVTLVEIDSAPDGQLGALLIRHQRRVRGQTGEAMNTEEKSEYRLVYNWGQSATEICEVWWLGDDKPHAYRPVDGMATGDDDWANNEAEEPAQRLRDRLNEMLAACDKPILRFPDDFTG